MRRRRVHVLLALLCVLPAGCLRSAAAATAAAATAHARPRPPLVWPSRAASPRLDARPPPGFGNGGGMQPRGVQPRGMPPRSPTAARRLMEGRSFRTKTKQALSSLARVGLPTLGVSAEGVEPPAFRYGVRCPAPLELRPEGSAREVDPSGDRRPCSALCTSTTCHFSSAAPWTSGVIAERFELDPSPPHFLSVRSQHHVS